MAVYNSFKRDIQNGSIDLDTDTINVMLVTSAYTPDIDLHTKRSDVTSEVVGTGYTAGGMALAGKTVTQENVPNTGRFDANDVVWTGSSITARRAILYKNRGGAATADELVEEFDFGSDKTSIAEDFRLIWASNGIHEIG